MRYFRNEVNIMLIPNAMKPEPSSRDPELTNSSPEIYLTFPIMIKFVQIMVGIACILFAASDLITNAHHLSFSTSTTDHLFIDQLTSRICFLVGTGVPLAISLIQLIWFPVSIFCGSTRLRIISGVMYHLIGFGSHVAVSLYLLVKINLLMESFYNEIIMRNIVNIGLANGGLYFISAVTALWYLAAASGCIQTCRQFSGKRFEDENP